MVNIATMINIATIINIATMINIYYDIYNGRFLKILWESKKLNYRVKLPSSFMYISLHIFFY